MAFGFALGRSGLPPAAPPTQEAEIDVGEENASRLAAIAEVVPAVKSNLTPEPADRFRVIRVIDGDTFEIEGGEKVRYIGIDTPESVDPRKPVQCFGAEASRRNKELVEGKVVSLERDLTDRDKYGRLLRYVWADSVFINLELVKQGYARAYSYPPDIKYQDHFTEAERTARADGLGLWGACGGENAATANSANAAPPETANQGCVIKGNISAAGERIYHLPECPYYSRTRIDAARGEKWFCAEDVALATGWRKAGNCP